MESMATEHNVYCERHGTQPEAFVCQHIAESLATNEPVGFHWPENSSQDYPDAWCSACNERHRKEGWEWTGDAAEQLNAKLLCAQCYLVARRLSLGY